MNADDELASGKRRSFSQRVGANGELAFRVFANRHGLIPTKVEEDFGIDFLFQVDLDHESKNASDIANTFAGACVRASQSDMGKVTLNRGDAANLLNSRSPLMFVLAHVAGNAESAIMYHRLVDELFMAELQTFLDSEHNTMSVLPSDGLPEDKFEESLGTLLSPGFTESVRLAVAEAGLNAALPNATVEIRRQPDGQLTLVSNIDYFSLFEQFDESQERDLLHAAFGVEAHLVQRVAQLNPRPEIIKYLRALPQPALLTGYTTEARVMLEVTLDGASATTEFTFRKIGTHYAYVHDAGISLIVSHARERDGQMVHDTEVFIDPLADNVLDDLAGGPDFFEMCVEGAVIREGGEDPATGVGFDVAKCFLPPANRRGHDPGLAHMQADRGLAGAGRRAQGRCRSRDLLHTVRVRPPLGHAGIDRATLVLPREPQQPHLGRRPRRIFGNRASAHHREHRGIDPRPQARGNGVHPSAWEQHARVSLRVHAGSVGRRS
jgi:hypothetical protein